MLTLAQVGGGGGFAVMDSLTQAFTVLMSYIPQIIGALIVFIIGYIIAKLVRRGITALLQKLRFDQRMQDVGNPYVQRFSPGGSPSALVATIVYALIMVFVLVATVAVLNIPAVTQFMNLIMSYIPNVIAAALIFLVALAVAGGLRGLAQRTMGDTAMGRIVTSSAPIVVMALAVFMILQQLNIAPVIVTITYAALMGALALGAALAFGLGGRDAAAQLINDQAQKAQQSGGDQRQG